MLNHYNEIVLLIDEIGGIALNIDEHSLFNKIKNVEKSQKSKVINQ